MARSKKPAKPASDGCEWVTCSDCGADREIPADPRGRGPQLCRQCGAEIVPASRDHEPGPEFEHRDEPDDDDAPADE